MTELDWFSDDSTLQKLVLAELSANLQLTFARVQELDCGFPIIRFLYDHPKTLITAEGIAAELKRPLAAVRAGLCTLEELGLVRRTEAAGTTFFGFDTDPAQRKLVCDLLAWQDLWHE